LLDKIGLDSIELSNGGGSQLMGKRRGRPLKLRARLVVDGSVPRGLLSSALEVSICPHE
jgi:hypothetical protein